MTWFPGGPSIHEPLLFLIRKDHGVALCVHHVEGFCSGQYSIKYIHISDKDSVKSIVILLSIVLFSKVKDVTEEFIKEIAKNVMLSTEDTQIWLERLTNVVQLKRQPLEN